VEDGAGARGRCLSAAVSFPQVMFANSTRSRKFRVYAWAGAAGDRSFWFAGIKKTGLQKVAGRLAHRMRMELFNGVKKSQ